MTLQLPADQIEKQPYVDPRCEAIASYQVPGQVGPPNTYAFLNHWVYEVLHPKVRGHELLQFDKDLGTSARNRVEYGVYRTATPGVQAISEPLNLIPHTRLGPAGLYVMSTRLALASAAIYRVFPGGPLTDSDKMRYFLTGIPSNVNEKYFFDHQSLTKFPESLAMIDALYEYMYTCPLEQVNADNVRCRQLMTTATLLQVWAVTMASFLSLETLTYMLPSSPEANLLNVVNELSNKLEEFKLKLITEPSVAGDDLLLSHERPRVTDYVVPIDGWFVTESHYLSGVLNAIAKASNEVLELNTSGQRVDEALVLPFQDARKVRKAIQDRPSEYICLLYQSVFGTAIARFLNSLKIDNDHRSFSYDLNSRQQDPLLNLPIWNILLATISQRGRNPRS